MDNFCTDDFLVMNLTYINVKKKCSKHGKLRNNRCICENGYFCNYNYSFWTINRILFPIQLYFLEYLLKK